MINKQQLRNDIIKPVLKSMDPVIPYSEAAVELLMMTAAHESRLGTYIRQINGPALGIYQMEPKTFADILNNFVQYRPKILDELAAFTDIIDSTEPAQLIGDLWFATAMARVHYYRVPNALPDVKDLSGLALYAKKHYNTISGKATTLDYRLAYQKLCTGWL